MSAEIKELLNAVIKNQEFARAKQEAFELEFRAEFADLRNEFSELKNEFADLRNDFADLRNEFADLRNEFSELKNEFSELRNGFFDFKNEVAKQNHIFEIRFDQIDNERRSIKRHASLNESELDAVITRVERLEQRSSY